MKVDISDILMVNGASMKLDFSEEPEEKEPVAGFILDSDLSFSGTLTNYNGIITLEGYLKTSYIGECYRCLRMTGRTLEIKIKEDYTGNVPEGEVDIYCFERKILDIGKAFYDNIILSLPMKHLCSEQCKGLCGRCGANLNEGQCGCGEEKAVDPRMEGLSAFLEHL
ncbi:MAG: YceD family protein [Bacillota bacterium]